MSALGQFYKPYLSDDEYESDSDTSVENDGYTTESSLCSVPGRAPPVETAVPAPITAKDDVPIVGTKFETVESRNTSLFTINSRDRDSRVYPLPTYFTLRLPRILKNIKQVNVAQINLLNSFFNFATDKGNTFMYVLESGRTRVENGTDVSNSIRVQIRNGTYTATDLVAEITAAMNRTPIFANISLTAFINGFSTTGTYTLLFNTPGEVVFNSLTQAYETRKTINDIVARYFQVVQTVGTVEYTVNQCTVAYYYPVMKEMIIEQPDPLPFSVVGQSIPTGFTSWYEYIVFAFQGLDDPYITPIALDPGNQTIFQNYHDQNTFMNFLVNKYTATYDSRQGRLRITAPSLNDSIATDLTNFYNSNLGSLVVQNGFTSIAAFSNSYSNVQNSNVALLEFYNYIQLQFAKYFAVNFGTYTSQFYTNINNVIELNNPYDQYGWYLTINSFSSSNRFFSNAPPTQVSSLWSNITVDYANPDFVSTLQVPEFTSGMLMFSNAGEQTFGYTDVNFRLDPTTYRRVTFNTRCRQNISLMTLPRYLNDRTAATDMYFNLNSTSASLLYNYFSPNEFYIKTDISGNSRFFMYTVEQNMFNSAAYMRAFDEWLNYMTPQFLAGVRIQETDPIFIQHPPINDIVLTSFQPFLSFQVNPDKYPVAPNAHFNITFYVETQDGSPFAVPILITYYKDRALFMSDALLDLNNQLGSENPRHYFKQQLYSGTNSAQMTVDVNNNQAVYFHVNLPDNVTLPSNIPLRVFCVLTDTYGVYTSCNISDQYGLPFSNLPPLVDQFTPASTKYEKQTNSIYDNAIFQLGYDISNVSNNLLDYIIQSGNTYFDPQNIGDYLSVNSTGLRYLFLQGTNGAAAPDPSISSPQTWSLYFGAGSSNQLRDTYNTTNNIYLSSLMTPNPLPVGMTNEHLLVNWFEPGLTTWSSLLVRELFWNPAPSTTVYQQVSTGSVFQPCINPSALAADMAQASNGNDSNGIAGIGFFLPTASIVKLDNMLVKFAYTQPSALGTSNYSRTQTNLATTAQTGSEYRNQTTYINTSNPITDWDDWYLYNRRNIKLGIYRAADIYNRSTSLIELSSAFVSMTLQKVTQVNNYTEQGGTQRTREPDWGTYYCYAYDSNSNTIWDVANVGYNTFQSASSFWRSTVVGADISPTYVAGENVYSNYFQTFSGISNYSYLPRGYGISPSVVSNMTTPIANTLSTSYVAVPFYYDAASSNYKVGAFWGLSFTQYPCVAPAPLIGEAPYYGPPGVFGYTAASTFTLYNNYQSPFTTAPYFWNTKFTFEVLDQTYNPATDLTLFGGYAGISGEYQDTQLFFYSNAVLNKDLSDISTIRDITSYWSWGTESASNYAAYDDQDGYNFLSYIYNVPVRPSTCGACPADYAVHVRGYDPIAAFNTGIRFIGKNFTDFGAPSFDDMINEISSIQGYTYISDSYGNTLVQAPALYSTINGSNTAILQSSLVSHAYADALVNFDAQFHSNFLFGAKPGYSGLLISSLNFSTAINQYINVNSSITGTLILYTTILSTVTGNLNMYVQDRYSNILPPSFNNRNNITAPLPFQFLFLSKTPEPYKSLPDEWGLGWNLGFPKIDTAPRTTILSDTFIRIVDDYIYLVINPELNMNMMAVSGKEDLSETRESKGQDQKYFLKIILNNFGGFCRAAVSLPKDFNPVLGKYETLTCQLVNKFGIQLSNSDCDYDFVLQATEINQGPRDTASLVLPQSANLSNIVTAQGGKKSKA
jgi:hypothetical protein